MDNAQRVKAEIWLATGVRVLVVIARHQLGIKRELHTILQILSFTLFEKVPLAQALSGEACTFKEAQHCN